MTDYTNYWKPATADTEAGKPIDFTWCAPSDEFEKGDCLWVMTVEDQRLFLLGKAVVLRKTDRSEASKYLSRDLDESKEFWLLFDEPFDTVAWRDITDIASDIRFISKNRDRLQADPPKWGYALQNTKRKLTQESVSLLAGRLNNTPIVPPEVNKDFWLNLYDNDFFLDGEATKLIGSIIGEVSNHDEVEVSDLAKKLGIKRTAITSLINDSGRIIATMFGIGTRRILPGQRYFANWEIFFDGRVDGKALYWKLKPALSEALEEILSEGDNDQVNLDDSHDAVNEVDSRTELAGAGFGDPISNREVEIAAIDFVTAHYSSQGWKVTSKERDKCGYDLLCEHSAEEHHVEVKGVKGSIESVIITWNEVAHLDRPESFVCIVTGALSSPELASYSGEEFKKQFKLEPYAFRAARV